MFKRWKVNIKVQFSFNCAHQQRFMCMLYKSYLDEIRDLMLQDVLHVLLSKASYCSTLKVSVKMIVSVLMGGSVAQWSELGIWIRKTGVQIPNSDYWMDLSSVILGTNLPRFVNSQLVCLLPVGILNWESEEWDFNMILKSPFMGVIIKFFF